MGALDYIDRQQATIRMLRNWHVQYWKLKKAPEKILEIDERMRSIRSSLCGSDPVQGGASRTEENLCNAIDRKTVAMQGLKKAKEYDQDISECWEQLTDKERFCLTVRFIDYEEGDGISKIMERFGVKRSEAYNLSNRALEKLSMLIYW